MSAKNPRPNRIDLQYINIRGLGREQLLVQSQSLICPIRRRDDCDRVPVLVRPFLCCRTAQLQFFADGAARDSNLRSMRRDETQENAGDREHKTYVTAAC